MSVEDSAFLPHLQGKKNSEDPEERRSLDAGGLLRLPLLQACAQLTDLPLPVAAHLLRVSKPLASLLLWVEVGGKGRGPHVIKTQATVQIDGIKS